MTTLENFQNILKIRDSDQASSTNSFKQNTIISKEYVMDVHDSFS